MIRAFLLFLALALPAAAETRPEGLMWNRSGLPLTLPLQVQSDAGADLYLELSVPETGEAVLGAYVRGGDFFRVLVPPGRWALTFARGTGWQGEEALFGPATEVIAIEPPLAFVAEAARKSGFLIDLRGGGTARLRDIGLCQSLVLDPASLSGAFVPQPDPRFATPPKREAGGVDFAVPRHDLRARFCVSQD